MEAPSSGLEAAAKAVATEEVLQRDCSRRSTRVAGLCSLHSRSQAAAGAREWEAVPDDLRDSVDSADSYIYIIQAFMWLCKLAISTANWSEHTTSTHQCQSTRRFA